ncbi:MAG: hypothetical protein E6Q97_21305 [Desulfurellales bacterium]|nr:MAG: hypothetical protein E6Q97_21305 [Desulfurellales bacterium]
MKRIALLGIILAMSAFSAEAPRQSASMSAAQNIRGQVGVMVAEVEDTLGRDHAVLVALVALESDIAAVAKTVAQLTERARQLAEDQRLRVDAMTAKHTALVEELEVIDRIIVKLEAEVGK